MVTCHIIIIIIIIIIPNYNVLLYMKIWRQYQLHKMHRHLLRRLPGAVMSTLGGKLSFS